MTELTEVHRESCMICGGRNSSFLLKKQGAQYVRCAGCGFVYTDVAPDEETLKRTAEEWARKHHASEERLQWEKYPRMADILFGRRMNIIDNYKDNGWLLDVGASTGFFLEYAMKRGWKVAGSELAGYTAAQARERTKSEIREGSFLEAGFEAGRFDVVAMWDVIEHALEPERFIREAFRVMRPGGLLAIATPNYNSLSRRIIGRRWEALIPSRHLQVFTADDIDRVVSRNGGRKVKAVAIDANPLDMWAALTGKERYSFERRLESISKTKELFARFPALARVRDGINVLLNYSGLGDVLEFYAEKLR